MSTTSRKDHLNRIYVLGLLSAINFMQCLVWFTYSSVSRDKFEEYYRGGAFPEDASDDMISFHVHLLLNWGPICGVLTCPLQGWLLTRPNGLRKCMRLSAWLVMLGAVLRCLPTLVNYSAPTASPLLGSRSLSLFFLHAGQALNAFAGSFVMGSAPQLSLIWFPEHLRAMSTAIGTTANPFGVTLGFLLGPWLVPTGQDYPRILLFEAFIAIVPWIFVSLYWPLPPLTPPSAAAAAAVETTESTSDFKKGFILALTNRNYGLLILAAGILAGAGSGLNGVLHDILSPSGYSDGFIGYLGFARSLVLNFGSVLAGRLSGVRTLRRHLKRVILAGLGVLLVAGLTWSLSCGSEGAPVLILCIISAMGLGEGIANPIFYELGAELTFPVPAGTSAGILVLLWNLTALAMIAFPAGLGQTMNWIYLGLVLACILLVTSVRERYLRPSDSDNSCQDRRCLYDLPQA